MIRVRMKLVHGHEGMHGACARDAADIGHSGHHALEGLAVDVEVFEAAAHGAGHHERFGS